MRSQWKRRVIPRWRASHVAAGRPECAPPGKAVSVGNASSEALVADVRRQVSEWSADQTVGVAADLLNFSHIPEARPLLEAPSQFILAQGDRVSPLLQSIARSVAGIADDEPLRQPGCQYEIVRLKERIRINPRDALSLLDLARLYAAQGQNKHARKAIITAASLQPNHRFVVRSASRFLVHNDDPDHAFHVLSRSARSEYDPWIVAALIAVETVRGRTPKNLRRARAIMEDAGHAPKDLSELGAAIATVFIDAGEMKNAKRLLNSALREPNDNVVAQAVWAANEFRMPLNVRSEWLSDAEACFYKEEDSGNFDAALKAAWNWFEDEPFSTRPLRGAAFAASIVKNFTYAEEAIRQAIRLDPHSIENKNNLVFTLLARGEYQQATPLLSEVIQIETQKEGNLSGHTLANIGMVYYRDGDIAQGRFFYERACEAFANVRQSGSSALAYAYWVQEALAAKDPEIEKIVARAKETVDKSNLMAAKRVLNDATGNPVAKLSDTPIVRPALTWTHDRTRNLLIIDNKQAFRTKPKQ